MTSILRVAIVMPCLNEEVNLAKTCASLGFGSLAQVTPPPNTLLVLVDNGSTDNTLLIQEDIRDNSPKGSVFVLSEPERGFVPPRHKGNLFVKQLCVSSGWQVEEILIIQADADTCYDSGYVNAMRKASELCGLNCLLEGYSEYDEETEKKFSDYISLSNFLDQVAQTSVKYDYIVDDKVSSYRLGDYLNWGGHVREYTSKGDEIHAETSRLFIKAAGFGARRVRVQGAVAHHSMRNVMQDPIMELATAGFPREMHWRDSYKSRSKTEIIDKSDALILAKEAIFHRLRHGIALFILLPAHIFDSMNDERSDNFTKWLRGQLGVSLPSRSLVDICKHPGVLIEDVLDIADSLSDESIIMIANWIMIHGRNPIQ